jgi:(1->4)-alpha-D-glucan 1-alpha-D-glucosylmutase
MRSAAVPGRSNVQNVIVNDSSQMVAGMAKPRPGTGTLLFEMKRIPGATYRLQFNREFTFQQAREILDYLRELGISDVYASPLFQAGPESTHGYDTCSFGKINSNLGSTEDFERFTNELKDRNLGLLLDLVPNHMSATLSNPWWLDVLENGRESRYANFFDINWRPPNPELRDKVLLPVLEDDYRKVLESGKLRLGFENGRFFIAYYERKFPVSPASVHECGVESSGRGVNEFNGKPGDARSFDKLDSLIQWQNYRLAFWRDGAKEINYRRFFDVTEMVALKMELPEVFQETHKLVLDWLAQGKITGLRIDHPDGLWDPKQYLERLQAAGSPYVVVEKILCGEERLPGDWPTEGTTGYDFLNRLNGLFVGSDNASAFDQIYREFTGNTEAFADIVYRSRKQILERSFASEVNALTCRLKDIADHTRSGSGFTFSQLHDALEEIAATFPVYRTYLTENAATISEQDRCVVENAFQNAGERGAREVESDIFDFIEQVLLGEFKPDEVGLKKEREFAMKFQQLTGPAMAKGLEDTAFYRFNRLISLNEVGGEPDRFGISPAEFHEANAVTAKFCPHTLLASATHDTKRGEDVRARLNVLSEMPAEWRETVTRWARMNRGKKTLIDGSPAPDANDEYLFYQTVVGAWPGDLIDVARLESFRGRVAEFMLKAVKEAKVHTSWTEPNVRYEKALQEFVGNALTSANNDLFVDDFQRFARRIAFFGRFNSLAQTLLKITSPGVPDFYQGAELWDLNLVDPDNRRQVNYAVRRQLLSRLKNDFEKLTDANTEFFPKLIRDEEPGAMKQFLIWRALAFRETRRELFDAGEYLPLSAIGEKQKHLCAFARQHKNQTIAVVAPRLVFGLTLGREVVPVGTEIWNDTMILISNARAGDLFRNVLTREMVPVVDAGGKSALELSQALKTFPGALLEKV